jgi:phosphatidylglycerol:prolipoprotein diacylglycerol transferase
MNPIFHDPDFAHLVHYLLEWLALTTGVWIYRTRQVNKGITSVTNGPAFSLIIGCLLGASIGNKAVFWLENPHLWTQTKNVLDLLIQGQSIVGGLLGGWIGVELAKEITHWTGPRTGDDFVPAILGGILVGRIGCFVAGLHDGTYGLPTDLPWGIDLGDGQPRHPAPLYEWLTALLTLISWPIWSRKLAATPGLAFRCFILGYMLWRLWIDGLKPVPYPYWLGLSGIQWICLISAITIAIHLWKDRKGAAS